MWAGLRAYSSELEHRLLEKKSDFESRLEGCLTRPYDTGEDKPLFINGLSPPHLFNPVHLGIDKSFQNIESFKHPPPNLPAQPHSLKFVSVHVLTLPARVTSPDSQHS